MTQDPDHGGGLPDRGPVEDFFARERARIEDLPGNDVHWQGIVRESRRRRRGGRSAAWVAAGVAAAVAVGVVAVWQGGPGDDDGLAPAGQASSPQTSRPGSPTSVPSPATSAPSGAPQVLSVSSGLDGRRTALVGGACEDGSGTCVRTRSSSDGGATWAAGPVLDGLAPAPTDTALPGAATGPDQAGFVGFASETVGVVGGSRSLLTTDGGQTWAPYDLPGTVLWLRADPAAGVVQLATAESCSAAACSGELTVLEMSAEDTTPREVLAVDAGDVVGLSVERSGEADLVAVGTPDGHEAYRVPEGGGPDDAEEVEVCEPDEGVRLAVPRSGGSVVLGAACTRVADDGSASDVVLLRSTDGGRTWSGRGEPTRLEGRVTGLAQPQVGTAVVVTDGTGDALYRSTDAGGTWTQLAGMFAPKGPFVGVDADDRGRVWATRAGSGGYAESRDDGETWSEITPG